MLMNNKVDDLKYLIKKNSWRLDDLFQKYQRAYQNKSFILKESGIRVYSSIPLTGYAGFRPQITPRLPKWTLKIDDLTMEISILS